MKRGLTIGAALLLAASLGCNAIPINLPDPGLSDGGVSDTGQKAGDDVAAGRGDIRAPSNGPDAGFSPMQDASGWGDGGWTADGAAPWLPDACLVDGGSGDAICPPPLDDGGLDDGGLDDGGPDDGGLDDGGPDDGAAASDGGPAPD
jgi:hypothetical protein